MNDEFQIVFKCRRCDLVFGYAEDRPWLTFKEAEAETRAVIAEMAGNFSERQLVMHYCLDGGMGIAQFVGCQPKQES